MIGSKTGVRFLALWTAVGASPPPGADPAALLRDASVRAALDAAKATEPRTLADQIRLCEIPAPPFKEGARADAVRTAFEQLGLVNVRIDKAGNVLGDRPGSAASERLVMAAHLDTVFPEGTDVRVRRQGTLLRGPAIGDNCRGLAVLIGTIRSLKAGDVHTAATITFVANVGEEGLGDLRGTKELFAHTLHRQIDRFVSIDGTGLFLANVAVGSHRYRVTFRGPGGHSFADFGTANPIQAMGRAIAKISTIQVPKQPRATYNIGRVEGGTSVNAIPAECRMEIDLRSSDPAALGALDAAVRKAIDAAVAEENDRSRTPAAITATTQLVGDRPGGVTPADSPIVQTAVASAHALGIGVAASESSTDANVPIQLKIPAIAIGAGGHGTHAHALDETFDSTDAWKGTAYAVLLAVALAR